ncbi:SAM-dependent methyltransferase [Pseudoxanthomonas broegbernensis]|uniref:SAM-dependent methyltransferase n=1 Tax=Pseudoxanthomonas broegbernensis TaxID=83619 RepID=A0A7V8GK29_9GAMM|nr:class I SAM-dependent methyltransferase [Pseudoxanthomonas broegbernensis]KAF1684804.1 SAM-dependent methyltransferase [Pseudoxanthomonas broegbernensis]MBB6066338.1 ubiquinone/menaquinone biosynthesis C-methylase UbiE [Pseudoxanthomonas broegbernensis]
MSQEEKPQFDAYAGSYDALHKGSIKTSGEEPAYFAEYKIKYIADSLGANATKKRLSVLDFGCGIGNSLPHLARVFPNAELRGADVSSESLQVARQSNPQVEFSLLTDGRIPLPDQSQDLVMAACVYHHIPPGERQLWTKEIRRVLKPGATFFIFEHNPLNPLTRHAVRSCEFDEDAILLSRKESLSLLSQAGMKDASIDYIVFFPRFLSLMRPFERHLGWLPLGAQYVAYARA